jgi:uncharacterized protein (DUF58 family)
MTLMRPARPWAPIPVSILVLFIWWVVAHNSGSGWVQFLGDAVFGAIVVGIFGPAFIVARTRVRLVASPTDATVGIPVPVKLSLSTRSRVRPIEPAGPETLMGPTSGNKGTQDELILLPSKRGVHSNLVLEVASAAPFAIQWWSRRMTIPVGADLHVAPRRGEPVPLPRLDVDRRGDGGRSLQAAVGDLHSVRSYQPGDQRRRVHWPATAHVGRLMVREMELPAQQHVTIKISLPPDEVEAERTAETAMGTAIEALDRATPLVMATDEPEGPVIALVLDRLEAGRRLARAVAASGPGRVEVSW